MGVELGVEDVDERIEPQIEGIEKETCVCLGNEAGGDGIRDSGFWGRGLGLGRGVGRTTVWGRRGGDGCLFRVEDNAEEGVALSLLLDQLGGEGRGIAFVGIVIVVVDDAHGIGASGGGGISS
jgi:hypothetical protein